MGQDARRAAKAPIGRRWLGMATIGLGVSLVVMDATVVNVALPVVIRDVGVSAAGAQWVNAVYSLVFAALVLPFGRLGDLFGRRRMYAVGLVVFTAASVAAGAATDQVFLVGARLVQGIGAAMVLPSTLSTLNAMFQGRQRDIAFAVWGSTIGGMAAVGPLLGGWLATDVSWRWAFWLNIPFGLLTLLGVVTTLKETRDASLPKTADVVGTVLVALGLAGIVFGLIEGRYYGWWRQTSGALSPVPLALAAGVALVTAFVLVEARRSATGRVALADLRLLRIGSFRYGALAALIVAFGEFGLLFALPLLLEGALGYSALGAGVLMLCLAVGTFLVSGLVPHLTRRVGRRAVVRIGLLVEAVAIAGLAATLSSTMASWVLAAWLFGYGVGVGMATAQLTSVVLSDVPPGQGGVASGFNTTVRQLGAALGVAVLGGLLIGGLASTTKANLGATSLPAAQQQRVTRIVHDSAGAAIPALRDLPQTSQAADIAAGAMVHAAKVTTGIAAGIVLVGLAATLALPRERVSARRARGAERVRDEGRDPVCEEAPSSRTG